MNKKILYLLSLVITIVCSSIPAFGVEDNELFHLFGFPSQVFGYSVTGQFSFQWLGFIFNFFLFYFFLLLIVKSVSKVFNKNLFNV
ncbi:hypothetical protein [Neobacillus sp. NPDC093127]|uniref:hypothetical protein n=1 Tax=Neobacillus sp. NPDC093127 TaxID=3364296 RepID=UPI0037FF9F51